MQQSRNLGSGRVALADGDHLPCEQLPVPHDHGSDHPLCAHMKCMAAAGIPRLLSMPAQLAPPGIRCELSATVEPLRPVRAASGPIRVRGPPA